MKSGRPVGGKVVFLLLIHKRSAEQGKKKSPLKSRNISHINLQLLTRQPYIFHLHIDREKVEMTNQLQKEKLLKIFILKKVNEQGDDIHMYW